jgi:hypothetical protein
MIHQLWTFSEWLQFHFNHEQEQKLFMLCMVETAIKNQAENLKVLQQES